MTTSNLLSSDLFAAATVTPLEIPELRLPDGTPRFVHVKRLSAADALRFYATQGRDVPPDEKTQGLVEMIGSALVNPDGSRLIHPSEMHKIGDIPMFIFKRIVDKVNEMSGIKADQPTAQGASAETEEGKG